MKLVLGAIALVFAAPLTAQTAPDPHADHAKHQKQGKEGHEEGKGCCKMVNGKMECQMMKGDASKKGAQDHSAH